VIGKAASALIVSGVAWGAYSFGAVYPWGYWPLAVIAAVIGLAGLSLARRLPRGTAPVALAATLTVVALAGCLQILPLPANIVGRLSPEASSIEAQYLVRNAGSLSLSISPTDTVRALALFAALTLLVVGGACVFTASGTTRVCGGIAVVGVLLALTGMVQKALTLNKPLGFWITREGGNPYGPFVNKNHFAGWMLMAIPLSLGLLCAMVSRQTRGSRLSPRDRLLWFASPEASRVVLLGAGAALMILSVFLTQSRSGMTGALAATAMTMGLTWRRYSGATRIALIAALATVVAGVVAWVGFDPIVTRFTEAMTHDIYGRTGVWADAWHLAQRYPAAGTGLNTYQVAMLFYQHFNTDVFYSAAHNDYLQVIAEGGVLVGLPVLAALIALIVTIHRRFREEPSRSTFWIRAGATIGLLSIAIQEIGDFSLQIPANAFLFAVVCAIAVHRTPERRRV
jgi:O-antigen ligase